MYDHHSLGLRAIELARAALEARCFPNGSLVASPQLILAESISLAEKMPDPTAHAEVEAIRAACREANSSVLTEYTLYTSLEPCLMCFHAAYWAGIRRIVYCCARELVESSCYEGTLSSVVDAAEHTFEKIELIYLEHFKDQVVELHRLFKSSSD